MFLKESLLFHSLLIFFLLLGNIPSHAQNSNDIHKNLMRVLMESKETAGLRHDDKLVIITSNYCENNNCELLFADYSDQLHFYTIEDGFMRKITKWVEIMAISVVDKNMTVRHRNGTSSKVVTYQTKD